MNCKISLPDGLVAELVEQIVPRLGELGLSAVSIEESVREVVHQIGGAILEAVLGSLVERYPAKAIPCPCGGHARYHFRRKGVLLTVYGRIHYQRAYYSCPCCHRGQYPLDRRLGLRPGEVSVALGSLLAILGSQTAFEESARQAKRLLLLDVSENTIRDKTQHYGKMQEQREAQWQEQSCDTNQLIARRRSVTDAPERLYGSLDGVIVPADKQWRELKVVCWYEAHVEASSHPEREPPLCRAKEIDYSCTLGDVKDFSPLVWASGYRRKADRAQEVVFIADGAAWIWKLVQYHFPQAIQIVDWYHAVSYLNPIAQALQAQNEEKAKLWRETTREHLWQGRIQEVIAACQMHTDVSGAKEAVHKAMTYYRNNAERMDYARWRNAGYLIGSGVVESACKQIGTQRLKRAGARWSAEGAHLTAKARAAWLSRDWDALTAFDLQLARAA